MTRSELVLDRFLPYRLSVTSNLVSDSIARTYEALFGLSIPQWRTIAVVAETGGISQAAIGARTRMDKVTVSRAAIALVGRALLERVDNPGDGRSHLLRLTATGQELHAQVAPKALELEQRILDRFDPEEIARFFDTLARIEGIMLDEVHRS